jgi:hypothetical protein
MCIGLACGGVRRSSFLTALTLAGGVIEACPAVVTGSPSANVFIEPDGTCTVTSTHDQIFARPYTYAGTSSPYSNSARNHTRCLTSSCMCPSPPLPLLLHLLLPLLPTVIVMHSGSVSPAKCARGSHLRRHHGHCSCVLSEKYHRVCVASIGLTVFSPSFFLLFSSFSCARCMHACVSERAQARWC